MRVNFPAFSVEGPNHGSIQSNKIILTFQKKTLVGAGVPKIVDSPNAMLSRTRCNRRQRQGWTVNLPLHLLAGTILVRVMRRESPAGNPRGH